MYNSYPEKLICSQTLKNFFDTIKHGEGIAEHKHYYKYIIINISIYYNKLYPIEHIPFNLFYNAFNT